MVVPVAESRPGHGPQRRRLETDLLGLLPTAVAYLSEPGHRFDFANDAFRILVGSRELLGRSAREAFTEPGMQDYLELLDRVAATGEPEVGREAGLELRRTPGGAAEQVWVDFACEPHRGESDAVEGVLVHAVDVTAHVVDRRRLERVANELAASEERYRTLFETMLHGVVYHDAEGAIIAVNPTAASMLGVEPEALLGQRPQDPRWHAVREDGSPLPGDEHPAMVALRTGKITPDVLMGVAHGGTGERRWISVTAVPDARDHEGRPQRAYAMFRDVTEERRTAAALHERDRLLGRLRDTNVLGVVVADEQRVLDANDAFLQMVGHDRDDLVAGRIDWRAMTPPEWLPRDQQALEEMRRSGSCRPFEKELVHTDGQRVPILIGAAVIDQDPMRWVTFTVDLSEQQRAERERVELRAAAEAARIEAVTAEERLDFLLGAGALVAATRDPDELLHHATRLVVPSLADFAAVFLPMPDGSLRVTAPTFEGVEGAAFLAEFALPVAADSGHAVQAAYRTGLSQLRPDLGILAVPLSIGADQLGVLALGRGEERAGPVEFDVSVIEELGRRLAVGLTHADAFAREHNVAESLQRSVLPSSLPTVSGLDLAVRYLPATEGVEVGGDWYDAFPLAPHHVGIVIGDVVGHNVASASVMAQVRNALRAYAIESVGPGVALARTNTVLSRLLPDAQATVFYAVLDVETGDLSYANAGHPPPLVSSPDGTVRYLAEGEGLMLGVDEEPAFPQGHWHLGPGQTLLLYTDGLVEDRSRSLEDGLGALAAVVTGRQPANADDLCTSVEAALLGCPVRADDVCLLAVRFAGSPAAQVPV